MFKSSFDQDEYVMELGKKRREKKGMSGMNLCVVLNFEIWRLELKRGSILSEL